MIRVLMFLVLVLLVAFGASWMADHPGTVRITFGGQEYAFSTLAGAVALVVAALAIVAVWSLLRFLFRAPSLVSGASTARRRQRGHAALSRGMIAVGSGDAEAARRHAEAASRLLKHDPMALLLQAQSAQMSGDRKQAEQVFTTMLQHPDTRTLALRGLYMEAVRRGDRPAALAHAESAQKLATLPWSTQAIVQERAAVGDWAEALKGIERRAAARIIDRPTANRHRAVLMTAMAHDAMERSPDEALTLARDALKLAPTLVPAAATAGTLLARKGEVRRATKILETAYAGMPHPDLAAAYLYLRHGDSAADRLVRAESLARQAPHDPESALMLARAALDVRDFARARRELAPLLDGRPTRRTCLLMAEIEEAEHGETGALLEWLQRASRAPRDRAWVADGSTFERWSPVSPVSGQLDTVTWTTPLEHIGHDDRTILHGTTSERESAKIPSRTEPPTIAIEPPGDETPKPPSIAPSLSD